MFSTKDGARAGRDAAECFLLLSWGGDWGADFGTEDGKSRSEDSLLASLASLAGGFLGNAHGSWRMRQREGCGKRCA